MQEDQPPANTGPTAPNCTNQTSVTRRPLIASRSEGDITITHAPRLTTGRTSLHDRLIAAQERNTLHQPTKNAPRNPLDKYLIIEDMPKVHVADPMSTLNFIDIKLAIEWENYTNGKLLAIPFGTDVNKTENHSSIAEKLFTAATEITQSNSIGISTPTPSGEAVRNQKTPTSFLIYNLSADEITTLTQRGVWSSSVITFRVAELHPPCPDFLFTIKGFNLHDEKTILRMVETVWQSNDTQTIADGIVEAYDEESRTETRSKIQDFLNSVKVKRLDFKIKGEIEAPRFNVYADGQLIDDDDVWLFLRESLASLPYTSPMHGHGNTVISPSKCGICHGVDHPTGMCEFPEKEGWKGPTKDTIEMASSQNGGNNSRGTRNNRQTKF